MIGKRLSPAEPVCRQYAQADSNEVLLEIEKTQRVPMSIALQKGLNVGLEGHVDDRSEERRKQVQDNDRIGESARGHRTKAAEEGKRPGVGRCTYGQYL